MRSRAGIRLALAALSLALLASAGDYEPVVPGRAIALPVDSGSHPGHRIEWWYVTGHLDSPQGPLGFQVTFFRVRNREAEGGASRFAPTQLLFAHAALADPALGRLRHDQKSARAGQELAEARTGKLDVFIEDWSLREESGRYRARIPAEGFTLDLTLRPTQEVLLQGERGYSRKGPTPLHASHYYSEPQLAVDGTVLIGTRRLGVSGTAWLDHEWSSELLAPGAVGWDWIGANLEGGAALMAFRLRSADGATLWAGATWREPGAPPRVFRPEAVRFESRRMWRSPRTGTNYPVAFDVRIADDLWRVDPLFDDQELDASGSTGTLYWEGAVRLEGPRGARGRGYLELTGYRERISF